MTSPEISSSTLIRWSMQHGAHTFGIAASVCGGLGVLLLVPASVITALATNEQPNWWSITAPWLALFDILVLAAWILGHWLGRVMHRRRGLPPFELEFGIQAALFGSTVVTPLLPLFFMLAAFKSEPAWVLFLTVATVAVATASAADAWRSSNGRRAREARVRRRFGLPDDAKIDLDTGSLIALAEAKAREIEAQKRLRKGEGRAGGGIDGTPS